MERLELWEKIFELIKNQYQQYDTQKHKSKATTNLAHMTFISYELLICLLDDAYEMINKKKDMGTGKQTIMSNGLAFLEEVGHKVEEKIQQAYKMTEVR